MASLRQIAANRLNAQKSTGPRTPEGKSASSANPIKSGIYAKSTFIPGEDPAEYDALRAEHYHQFAPATPDERDLLDLMIKYKWQLRRLHDSYDQLWIQYDQTGNTNENPPLAATFIRANLYSPNLINVSRIIHSTDRAFHRTRTALIRTQEKRRHAEQKAAAESQPGLPAPPPQADSFGFVPAKNLPSAQPVSQTGSPRQFGFVSPISPALPSLSPTRPHFAYNQYEAVNCTPSPSIKRTANRCLR
jgi:hypothetical protein